MNLATFNIIVFILISIILTAGILIINKRDLIELPDPKPTTGYGYDELKDFDMGYKDSQKSKITPFFGRSR
jgi:hypothetical protein